VNLKYSPPSVRLEKAFRDSCVDLIPVDDSSGRVLDMRRCSQAVSVCSERILSFMEEMAHFVFRLNPVSTNVSQGLYLLN
jgi:hypothetical protein